MSTPHEQAAALAQQALRELELAGFIERPPTLLEMTRRDLERLVLQGIALNWMLEQLALHHWRSNPTATMSQIIKRLPRRNLVEIAHQLGKVGIHDLDELLLPADPEVDR